jgi:hypothetical protein
VGTIAWTAACWSKLGRNFRIMSTLSVSLILAGFSVCVYYLATLNTIQQCIFGRKLAYALFYLGFFVFDLYQLIKIVALTNASRTATVVLSIALCGRLASYIVNAIFMQAKLTGYIDTENELGSCTSSFTDMFVYQEHGVSILYETCLGIQFLMYLRATYNNQIPVSQFLRSVVDFETFTFFIYLFLEFVYIMLYSWASTLLVGFYSLINTFYLNIPVAIFLANLWAFERKRKSEQLKRQSMNVNVNQELANKRMSLIQNAGQNRNSVGAVQNV